MSKHEALRKSDLEEYIHWERESKTGEESQTGEEKSDFEVHIHWERESQTGEQK